MPKKKRSEASMAGVAYSCACNNFRWLFLCVGGRGNNLQHVAATTLTTTKTAATLIELLGELVSILIAIAQLDLPRLASTWLPLQRQQREHEMCNELWQPQRFIEARPGLLTKLLNKRPTAMDSACIAFWSTPTATATTIENNPKQAATTCNSNESNNNNTNNISKWTTLNYCQASEFWVLALPATVWGKPHWGPQWVCALARSRSSLSFSLSLSISLCLSHSHFSVYILFNCIRGWCRHKAHTGKNTDNLTYTQTGRRTLSLHTLSLFALTLSLPLSLSLPLALCSAMLASSVRLRGVHWRSKMLISGLKLTAKEVKCIMCVYVMRWFMNSVKAVKNATWNAP